jgi:hypothetical protein
MIAFFRARAEKNGVALLAKIAIPLLVLSAIVGRAADYPVPAEGDYAIRDFKFASGESLPELRIHYRTIGKLEKDANGMARNAVLITHGTMGSGAQFIRPEFARELFGAGQPLDAAKFFIILPDGIGHGEIEQSERRAAREVEILEIEIQRVPHGCAVVIPRSEKTRGHGSHTIAVLWKDDLVKLLTKSDK